MVSEDLTITWYVSYYIQNETSSHLSDGGGVRGYSSLLVLQELIRIIGKLETASLDDIEHRVEGVRSSLICKCCR